jgi:hypothetical protein
MTLVSKYTTLLLQNELEYSFDNKSASDYVKSVTDIMESFKDEILQEAKFAPSGTTHKLKRLSNANNV